MPPAATSSVNGLACASVREYPPTGPRASARECCPTAGGIVRSARDGLGLVADRLRSREDRVRDAEASRRFYRTVLAALGITPLWEGEHGGQYANLVVSPKAAPGGPIHIGFVARSRAEVEAFHRAGLEAGHADNGAPGVREQYSSEAGGLYYAAFLLDPDGNNIEAVYRADFS